MNSMPLLIEFFLLDILQANICLLRGKYAVQQSYWPFPPEKIPCPTYIYFHLHGSYYSYCCSHALFWGLCVHLWRNWVHSTGFCLPFYGIFESGKNAQGCQMSPFNAAPQFCNIYLVLSCCSVGLHWCSQVYHRRYQNLQVLSWYVSIYIVITYNCFVIIVFSYIVVSLDVLCFNE